MAIRFKHTATNQIKEAPEGISWTTFFFGFFPALLRGSSWTIKIFLLSCVTFGLAGFYFTFKFNKLYMEELLEKGYVPANPEDKNALIRNGVNYAG